MAEVMPQEKNFSNFSKKGLKYIVEVSKMNLLKKLPLAETTFYILLALKDAVHGYAIMQKAGELSGGKVRIAAGTMYGVIENLAKQKLIVLAPGNDSR